MDCIIAGMLYFAHPDMVVFLTLWFVILIKCLVFFCLQLLNSGPRPSDCHGSETEKQQQNNFCFLQKKNDDDASSSGHRRCVPCPCFQHGNVVTFSISLLNKLLNLDSFCTPLAFISIILLIFYGKQRDSHSFLHLPVICFKCGCCLFLNFS